MFHKNHGLLTHTEKQRDREIESHRQKKQTDSTLESVYQVQKIPKVPKTQKQKKVQHWNKTASRQLFSE